MRVLVTGVGGFIGAHVARRFVTDGHDVIGVDDFSTGYRTNVPAGVHLIEGDLADASTMEVLPRGCDAILHLAGQSSGEISFDDPVRDLQKNTVSTLNLIRFGIASGAGRIVYASSMSVYGGVLDAPVSEVADCRPLSCYGVGKLAAEGYLRVYSSQLPFVALRMFNVFGPGQDLQNMRQGMVSILLAQALESGRVHVKGSLERFRDFIYIDDVVEAWWQAVHRPTALGLAINVGTGVRVTVGALLRAIKESVPETSWYVEGATPGDQSGIYADVVRLREVLGVVRFRSLRESLPSFVEWARTMLSVRAGVTR